MIVLAAYGQGEAELSNGVWRVSFGIGLILPVALLFFRLRMLDSEQYAKHAMRDRIPYVLVLKRYWKSIIGTSMAWFMYDFVVSRIRDLFGHRCEVFFAAGRTDSKLSCAGLSIRHFQFNYHLRPEPRG